MHKARGAFSVGLKLCLQDLTQNLHPYFPGRGGGRGGGGYGGRGL